MLLHLSDPGRLPVLDSIYIPKHAGGRKSDLQHGFGVDTAHVTMGTRPRSRHQRDCTDSSDFLYHFKPRTNVMASYHSHDGSYDPIATRADISYFSTSSRNRQTLVLSGIPRRRRQV